MEVVEVYKVFSMDRFEQRLWSRSLTFLFLVVLSLIFILILGRQSHPQFRVMRLFKWFLALFTGRKKCEVRRESKSEGAFALELMDSGGLCGR